jgi:hypothetical protein
MDPLYIGIFGSAIFIIAWAYELYEELFKHEIYTDRKFAYMNAVGITAMIIYSYITDLALFLYLNIILLVFVCVEIILSLHMQKKKSRKRSK